MDLYDHSHPQDKQLHDDWMKCIALFARLNVLLGGVIVAQEARCKDVDGWVDARMMSHTQSISSSAASSVLCSMCLFPFSFSNFLWCCSNAAWRRSYNSCMVSLLGDVGCCVGDSCHSSCLRMLLRSTETLYSLSISVLTWRTCAIIFFRLSASRCMASRVAFITCTSFILMSIPHQHRNDNDESVCQTSDNRI